MLLRYSFGPRRNNGALVTAGSVMTIGLSINGCSQSKKPVRGGKTRLTSPKVRSSATSKGWHDSGRTSFFSFLLRCQEYERGLFWPGESGLQIMRKLPFTPTVSSFVLCFCLEKSYKFYRIMANYSNDCWNHLTFIFYFSSIHQSIVLKTWQHLLYSFLAQMTNWLAQKTCSY